MTPNRCDLLWEKGYFRANVKFSAHMHKAKNSTLLVVLLFVTGENYAFASIFSCWSGVDLPLLVPPAPNPSCGRCLHLYCVTEIPDVIPQNNVCVRVHTFRCIVLEGSTIQTCSFRQRIQQAYCFRMVCVTCNFKYLCENTPFPRVGHI